MDNIASKTTFKAVVTYFKYSRCFKSLQKFSRVFLLHMAFQKYGKNELNASLKWQDLLIIWEYISTSPKECKGLLSW